MNDKRQIEVTQSKMYKSKSFLRNEIIYIDGVDKTDKIESYFFDDDKCVISFYGSDKHYSYHKNKIQIIKSAIQSKKADDIFTYLKEIAAIVGLKTEEGNNILADSYDRISFIPEHSILYNYLNNISPENNTLVPFTNIFPFGFNLSQRDAVNIAFSNPLSVIEGPPGTGKTQTILNIISNAVMNGQSVAVVSSNNSATKNVYEKLEKNGISFIAALLGSSINKKEFIESQAPIPDLSQFKLTRKEKGQLQQDNNILFIQLTENLAKKNELASIKLETENIETEYQHFIRDVNREINIKVKKKITSDELLSLWFSIEREEKFKWWNKLFFYFKYGVKNKSFYLLSKQELINNVQTLYYQVKIAELTSRGEQLSESLKLFSFEHKMKEYTEISMKLFKNELYKKYGKKKRTNYSEKDLFFKSEEFIKDYPVIMSTTYSLRRSLAEKITYDFVIIDESSQVDLTTGVLVLSCAKQAVIVGDLKQLPNVIDSDKKQKTDAIFRSFNLPEPYNYSSHSLLLSLIKLFPELPKTLLREHYRCHPKIIEFCNRRFYDNQLIILSEPKSIREPLKVHRTVPGNHARGRINQRQIDVIIKEIIPQQQLENVDLGIVSPYRDHTDILQETFYETQIKIDTVDKFQGRENSVIILSTVDNHISEFTDDPNRLNVAISRAIDQLIVLVHGNRDYNDSNITDLIGYIDYNNFEIVHSEIRSIFDYLYKGYEKKRKEILSKKYRKSPFDSENLMYALISEVLSLDNYLKYDVILHFPIQNLIADYSRLTNEEESYAKHHSTHLDFLIFNKLSKTPVLAIEVDGFEFHKKQTQQGNRDQIKNNILKKYDIPLLRFSTTGSGEREKLIQQLDEIK